MSGDRPRIAWDNRVGDRRDLSVTLPEGVERLMLVPEDMRKGVVFVYYSHGGERKPAGTAFFLAHHDPESQRNVPVLMTARHVIVNVHGAGDDGLVHLRINAKGGGAFWHTAPNDNWTLGDNLDFAYTKWFHLPDADYRAWTIEPATATDEVIRQQGIGVGDEVFMVGLFRNHLGRDRNEPIIRVGNIAAIPADGVRVGQMGGFPAFDSPAILIEARSIGGLSGSPVFVHMGWARWRDGEVVRAGISTPFFWLGVMHGHWDISNQTVDAAEDQSGGDKTHSGIGIVVPADAIMKQIRPDLEEALSMKRNQWREENTPTQDSLLADEASAGTPEFGRFEDLTRRLLTVPKAELDAIREQERRGTNGEA